MNRLISVALITLLLDVAAQAQDYDFGNFSYGGNALPYRYLLPEMSERQKIPLVIFLHGAGERGHDNQKQLTHGGKLFADSLAKYPAMVVFPQCREDAYWPNARITKTDTGREFFFEPNLLPDSPLLLVDLMIDSLIKTGIIDATRIYVGGLSMGGMGTYALVAENPDLFAAALSICGAGNTDIVGRYAQNTPFWIFHGAMDDVVPADYSIAMSTALIAAGGDPILTIYPRANHNSWDAAFAETELINWLFAHQKTKN